MRAGDASGGQRGVHRNLALEEEGVRLLDQGRRPFHVFGCEAHVGARRHDDGVLAAIVHHRHADRRPFLGRREQVAGVEAVAGQGLADHLAQGVIAHAPHEGHLRPQASGGDGLVAALASHGHR